jgi:Amt family ammonium transporter
VWSPDGWLYKLGALDFAGGTVVHVNVGMSALAMALVIGPRKDYGKANNRPNNIPLVLIGLGLLWIGWFGFNGGSSLDANAQGAVALLNTNLAACMAAITWAIMEYYDKEKGRSSLIGMGTGVLAGLVGITPAAGYVAPWAAILIGIITPIPCYFMLKWRGKSKIDESLDAFACHGVGGMTGAFLTGIFASLFGTTSLITGNYGQVGIQLLAIVVVGSYAFVLTFVIGTIIKKTVGLRVSPEEELIGLDITQHNEIAYEV